MADETNTTAAPTAAPEIVYEIERNGVKGPFIMVEKSRGDEKPPIDKDGKPDLDCLLKGEKYPAPYITQENFLSVWLKWFGPEYVVDTTSARANQWAQRIMESTKEQNNHEFHEATWLSLAPQLQFRGEKLSVLQDRSMELLDKLADMEAGSEPFTACLAEIQKLKVLIRDKKRSPRESKEGNAGDNN